MLQDDKHTSGAFTDLDGERHYVIRHVDGMAPFFVSVVSDADHWLFVSSTGGLTAGRVSPDTALFPYVTVDRIHESLHHTGPKTIVRVEDIARGDGSSLWEPFNREHDGRYRLQRNLYKNVVGNRMCFEEVNEDLSLAFRYVWSFSDEFGFVRSCTLTNLGGEARQISMIDGLLNILPAGTPRFTQTNSSNLVDAYKWTELDTASGVAMFTLFAGITDRPAPCESLKANVAWCHGLDAPAVLLSTRQLAAFRTGTTPVPETRTRGIRGAFLVHQRMQLEAGAACDWDIVLDTEYGQAEVVALGRRLKADRRGCMEKLRSSIAAGTGHLASILARCDGEQATAEEHVFVHHQANTLWNVLRGGYFPHGYEVPTGDLRHALATANRKVHEQHAAFIAELPGFVDQADLLPRVRARQDRQLERLCREYLPITFGRRHGDPSRPWNQFSIRLRDAQGEPRYWYEGNWRDLFQNWEALALSHPGFVASMIAKFVNASTLDGYNPYRITKDGIDWEVEDPEDPWSYIGYWGDHQIIYLLKLLEISRNHYPKQLGEQLSSAIYAYANVPYRIRSFDALLSDPKNTIDYDEQTAEAIEARLAHMGSDAKLVLDANGDVYLVTLLEKLLVPVLAKLGNLVLEGGIWMNTQRPEWNDANNALVGQGLSMVTLCYLRRYVAFIQDLLDTSELPAVGAAMSGPVADWLRATADAMEACRDLVERSTITPQQRLAMLTRLGEAAADYRARVYGTVPGQTSTQVSEAQISKLLSDTLVVLDQSILANRRDDGLYHAYNLLSRDGEDALNVSSLYPMLEGQVAVLSAGTLSGEESANVIEALYASQIYRPDQQTFMLYPDRPLRGFLERNRIDEAAVKGIALLAQLIAEGDTSVILRDADGHYRFSAEFTNAEDLDDALDRLEPRHGAAVAASRDAVHALFEHVFEHHAFTGRSGTMFGFEGLGCVYWHMVSKLLLAVQESFFRALADGEDAPTVARLGALYYRVRAGIGFNKTPNEFGAFPMDAYSHTPGHAGARQPGMTGQVKEELVARMGELGVRIAGGTVRFQPALLRAQEFVDAPRTFRYLGLDGSWQELELPGESLAYTWCQVPVCYTLAPGATLALTAQMREGTTRVFEDAVLDATASASLFARDGQIQRLQLTIGRDTLLGHPQH